MPFEISLDEERAMIVARHYGKITVDEINVSRSKIGRIAQERGWSRVFIDAREIRTRFSVTEVFELGTTNVDHGFTWSMKLAIIVEDVDLENARFYETVSQNRGTNVRLFESEQEALAWLIEEPRTVAATAG